MKLCPITWHLTFLWGVICLRLLNSFELDYQVIFGCNAAAVLFLCDFLHYWFACFGWNKSRALLMFPLWVPMTSTFQGGPYTHNISQQFHHVTKRLHCPRSKHLLATCIDLYNFKYHHIVSTVLNTPSVLSPWLSPKATSTTHIACCKMQQSTEALKVFWMFCLDQKGVLRYVTKRLHPSFLALKWRWCCVFNNDLHLSQQYSDIIIYIL